MPSLDSQDFDVRLRSLEASLKVQDAFMQDVRQGIRDLVAAIADLKEQQTLAARLYDDVKSVRRRVNDLSEGVLNDRIQARKTSFQAATAWAVGAALGSALLTQVMALFLKH